MKRTADLATRLKDVLLDGRWIANTNYREQLQLTHWQQATQKVGNLNTIAALTFHINYYLDGLLQVFNGGPLAIKDQYSFDLPPVASPADWQKLRDVFLSNAEKFIAAVQYLEEARLDEPFVAERYGTYLRNVEGVIEHCYYHLGQVVLIRKLISF